ncbi:hypothetical protein KC19_2G218800 [Ceratodon purpureus]|uniref:Glycosyltransferase 2-like domain-containing protein n=1 Tax=Ceratodon purpureus TaxID=3225 RepID=A0A8T0IWN0_CERPU|nr:hypothetical protein KC19_2G218800 [Ceratodon purpureus]
MASCLVSRFGPLGMVSASWDCHSRAAGVLERASVGVFSLISRGVSLRSKAAGGAHGFGFGALVCNVMLSHDVAGESLFEAGLSAGRTSDCGEEGLWSVVIPTYNRLPILRKCLQALEEQEGYERSGIREYEVVVVDDGSTDGTLEFLQVGQSHDGVLSSGDLGEGGCVTSQVFPHVKVIRQQHGGATRARNLGVREAGGAVIVFIDSDLVVTKDFLREHGAALSEAQAEHGDDCTFTYGRVVNTANFENPKSEKFKLTDNSAAFFATGNVALSRRLLLKAGNLLKSGYDGPFDADFSEYGWEDLELGVRLKQVGARIKHVPLAVGYHWHPAFSMDQIPKLIDQERQRGRNGVRFFLKHPNLDVRLMTQLTPLHEGLWFLLTLGGLLNEKTLSPFLVLLVAAGHPGLAAGLLSPTLNWHTVQASKEEVLRLKQQGKFVKREP